MTDQKIVCPKCKKEITKNELETFGSCENCKDEKIEIQEESDYLSGVFED